MVGFGCLAAIIVWILPTDDPPPVVGINFDVDSSSAFSEAAAEIGFLNLRHEPGAEPQIFPSQSTELDVGVDGCNPEAKVVLSVFPDPRWWLAVKASRRDKSQRVTLIRGSSGRVYTIPPGGMKGVVGIALPGEIEGIDASVPRGSKRSVELPVEREVVVGAPGTFTLVKARVTGAALRGVRLSPFFGQSVNFAFRAPWVHPRGFKSCFVAMPALVEGQGFFLNALGAEGLGNSYFTSVVQRGPQSGTVRLHVESGSMQPAASSPPPSRSQAIPTWTCSNEHKQAALRPDCHSTVVIEEPNSKEWRQALILVLGAIGSFGLVGFVDGLRKYWAPWE